VKTDFEDQSWPELLRELYTSRIKGLRLLPGPRTVVVIRTVPAKLGDILFSRIPRSGTPTCHDNRRYHWHSQNPIEREYTESRSTLRTHRKSAGIPAWPSLGRASASDQDWAGLRIRDTNRRVPKENWESIPKTRQDHLTTVIVQKYVQKIDGPSI
jgi:hypothetical protein